MVTIPGSSQVRPVSAGVARTQSIRASSADFGGGTGAALQQGGAVIAQVADDFARAERAQKLSGATAQATARLKELEFQFEQDPDFATYEQRYNENADQILAETKEELGDGPVFNAFKSEFATSRQTIGFNVRRKAREKQVDAGKAQLVRNLDLYSDLYARSSNENEQADIRAKALVDLAEAAEVGLITEEDRAKRELNFDNDSEAVLVRRLIQSDPETAEAMLTDPERFRNLNEKTRVALTSQASSRADTVRKERIRLAEKAERDADKAVKDAQEQKFGEMFDRIIEGAATDRDLDQALADRSIDGGQFVRLRTALEAEAEAVDDPNVVLTMYEDLDAGLLTKERVLTAFSNGLITRERATELRGAIDRGTNEVEKNALQFVRDNVGGIRGPLAVLDSQSSIREASAVREFRERVAADEDPWVVADDVAQRYRRVEPGLSSLPKPMFVSGDPDTLQGVEASMKRTVEAFEKQQIDEETFRREAEALRAREDQIRARDSRLKEKAASNTR